MARIISGILSVFVLAAAMSATMPNEAAAKECKKPLVQCKSKPGSCCRY